MADTDIIPFGAAIAGDVLSAFHLPGGNTLTTLAGAFVEKKRREAANILIDELSKGHHGQINFEEHDVDPLIEIILRFSKAVEDGAARDNLKFLAQVIAGLKKNKALSGDSFRRWCKILEDLTRDELLIVGMAYSIRKDIIAAGKDAPNDFWQKLQERLRKAGYAEGEISALCSSVSRTGLLVGGSAYGGLAYMPSPWLEELGNLANIGAAIELKRS